MSRPECYVLEGAAILAEGDLAFGSSVQIVEHGPGTLRRARGRKSSTQTTGGGASLREDLRIILSLLALNCERRTVYSESRRNYAQERAVAQMKPRRYED